MPVARVVTFEGVSKDRMEEMDREMREGQPPEGFPATEILALHDPEAEKSLVILFFETDDDYKRGDEVLNAMPVGEFPRRFLEQIDVRRWGPAWRCERRTARASGRSRAGRLNTD